MKKIIILMLAVTVMANAGCTTARALKGSKKRDTASLAVGQDRASVIKKLGKPAETRETPDGLIDIFNYKVGDRPSPFRAFGHLILNIFTFFVWELLGGNIEKSQGTYETIRVEYDQNNLVRSMHKIE